MATSLKSRKDANAVNSKNRRSRKKRRTEISSSEEDSSSSSDNDSDSDINEGEKEANEDEDIIMKDKDEDKSGMEIDNLQMQNISNLKENNKKTDKDISQTRLKLRQMDDINILQGNNNNTGKEGIDTTGISSDEWLKMMLVEYGDDIETLRTKAADFRGESISILAEMLRSTKDIFREV